MYIYLSLFDKPIMLLLWNLILKTYQLYHNRISELLLITPQFYADSLDCFVTKHGVTSMLPR